MVFAQETEKDARRQRRVVDNQLRARFPKLAAMIVKAEDDVLAQMAFPKEHRAQIHSTNPLERINGGRYMSLETLAGMSDNRRLRLPAIAA